MEQTDVVTQCRYTLCAITGERMKRIAHADDLAEFVPVINKGAVEAYYAIVDRAMNARIAHQGVQWEPQLGAYLVAEFVYKRIEKPVGIGGGNARFRGRFTQRIRTEHANPITAEQLESAIEGYYETMMSIRPLEAAAV